MRRAFRLLVVVLAVATAALLVYEGIALYRAQQRTPAVLAEAAKGELALSDLSDQRRAMLLRVEDPGFYEHGGLDFSTSGQGMTNLTQSLVKIFYFHAFQPGFAKLEQSLIAASSSIPA